LQKKYDIDYIFISMDKTADAWKKGIEKHQLKGDHYFSKTPWKKSAFCTDINLDWIPRYMVIGKDGSVKLFKATKATDKAIVKAIEEDK
jgi:hypothetical protein